jgi:hypothetical protein
MKKFLFLDDLRLPYSEDWFLVKTSDEAIAILKTFRIEKISLDHDLGESGNGTGLDVLNWLEESIFLNSYKFTLNEIILHSQNPVGVENMFRVANRIKSKIENLTIRRENIQ